MCITWKQQTSSWYCGAGITGNARWEKERVAHAPSLRSRTCLSFLFLMFSAFIYSFVFPPFMTFPHIIPPIIYFTNLHLHRSSLPSIRPGLSAGSRHLPAAAWGEACHTSTSALWEENGRTSAWERGQNHRETGLPARLQHPEMYDRSTCETLKCLILFWQSLRVVSEEDKLMVEHKVRKKLIWITLLLPLQPSHTSHI